MYNKMILVGNLTRDVEMRYAQSGLGIAKLGLATNRKYKTQQGEQKEEVCFVDISMFGRTAEIANQYLRKGSKVLVEGRLVLEQWTDQNGQKRSKHSVTAENMQMLNTGDQGGGNNSYNQDYSQPQNTGGSYGNQGQPAQPQQQPQQKQPDIPEIDIDNEEPPF